MLGRRGVHYSFLYKIAREYKSKVRLKKKKEGEQGTTVATVLWLDIFTGNMNISFNILFTKRTYVQRCNKKKTLMDLVQHGVSLESHKKCLTFTGTSIFQIMNQWCSECYTNVHIHVLSSKILTSNLCLIKNTVE